LTRKVLTFSLLMFGLIGCSLLGDAGGDARSASTDEGQTISQTASVAEDPSTPAEVVPVPTSSIQIEGAPYAAYQIPGDPFRIVCEEPCALDEQYIFAEYAGFRRAHAMLIELTGVDALAELQPVDVHLELEDSVCGELPVGHANVYSHVHQAYICTDGPGYYPSIEEKTQMAARPDGQYFPLHEYMHTIFFGRISGRAGDFRDYKAMWLHDYVVPIPSYALGFLDRAEFCSNHDEPAPGDYEGWLIYELCRQNGFQLEDLAQSLIELDRLYHSGGGQDVQEGYEQPVPTIAQYRDILNSLLGGDTTSAFAEACWPPQLFGNSYSVRPACVVETVEGTATPVQ
jgi:hypothetical protein